MNKLNNYLKENNNKKILLLVSGGSAFNVLNEIEFSAWNKNITIGMIDERYSNDSNINNFIQMKNISFWKDVIRSKCEVINSEVVKGETLGKMSDRLEKSWKKWKKKNKKGEIIVLLGMGNDGHTAGIMPYPDDKDKFGLLFMDTDRWVVGYDCEEKNQYRLRITATGNFLNKIADKVFLYFRGKEKELMFDLINSKKIHELPIKIIENKEFELL